MRLFFIVLPLLNEGDLHDPTIGVKDILQVAVVAAVAAAFTAAAVAADET